MDRDGFTSSVERYQNTVYRLALHILGSPQDADDAVQEVFLRLLGSARQPGEGEHLRRWLLRVTVNYCRDVLKSPWRRRRIDLEELPEPPGASQEGSQLTLELEASLARLRQAEEEPGGGEPAGPPAEGT